MNVLEHLAQSLEHILQARNGSAMTEQQISQIKGTIDLLQQHEAADEAQLTLFGQRIDHVTERLDAADALELDKRLRAIEEDEARLDTSLSALDGELDTHADGSGGTVSGAADAGGEATPPVAVVSDDPVHVGPTTTEDTTHDTVIVTDHPTDGTVLATPVTEGSADDLSPGDVTVDPTTGVPSVPADSSVTLGETTVISADAGDVPTAAAVAAENPDAVVSAGPEQAS